MNWKSFNKKYVMKVGNSPLLIPNQLTLTKKILTSFWAYIGFTSQRPHRWTRNIRHWCQFVFFKMQHIEKKSCGQMKYKSYQTYSASLIESWDNCVSVSPLSFSRVFSWVTAAASSAFEILSASHSVMLTTALSKASLNFLVFSALAKRIASVSAFGSSSINKERKLELALKI